MGGKRATQPVDEATFEGRLRLAVLASPYSAQEIAEACGRASEQSVYDWWSPDKSGSPNPKQLRIIAEMTGRSAGWLITGEERDGAQPESDWLRTMRAFEQRLSSQRQRELNRMAEVMLDEDRKLDQKLDARLKDAEAKLRALGTLDEETIALVLRGEPSPATHPGKNG